MIEVRSEAESDERVVDVLLEAAFGGRRAEPELVVALRSEASPALSLVAVVEGEVAGHVFVSPATIVGPAAAPAVAALAPLGVHPDFQRRGVGSALMYEAIDATEQVGWKALFLLGNPAYYSRFGFELSAPRGIRYKSENFDPHFQVRELEARCLDGVVGEFVYHEAFEALPGD